MVKDAKIAPFFFFFFLNDISYVFWNLGSS